MPRYIVMIEPADIPFRDGKQFSKVAVVKLRKNFNKIPKTISMKARGIETIVNIWYDLYMGLNEECGFQTALRDAQRLCNGLNKKLESIKK